MGPTAPDDPVAPDTPTGPRTPCNEYISGVYAARTFYFAFIADFLTS
jgi:hypothetical protein